jgi:DNA-binding CsgD family transcriptional regulator
VPGWCGPDASASVWGRLRQLSPTSVGRWAARRPWLAIAVWLAFVLAAVGALALTGSASLQNGAVGESARGYAMMDAHQLSIGPLQDANTRRVADSAGDPRVRSGLELLSGGSERVGYLLKERVSDLGELSVSIRRIARGGSVLDPAVVNQLVGRPRNSENPLEHLTAREREVLTLLAEGRSNKAIADRLVVTEHTVEKHVKSILGALGIPPSPDDHRRVLAVLTYLHAE